MSHIVPVLLALLATAAATDILISTLSDTSSVVSSALVTVLHPVEETAVEVLSSQCTTVKQLLRQDYNQSSPPDLSKLTLNLYTSDGQVIYYNLSTAAQEFPASPWYNNQSKIIAYMHGFIDNPSGESFQTVSNAFLGHGVYSVLALDSSSELGLTTLYIGATTNVRYIGEALGYVLTNLTEVGTDASSIYLIGHSLGAHIAGYAAKTFANQTGTKVARVTGLDPAGPCYTDIDEDLKLKSTDADFVDVVHTDAGVFGLDEQIGHVDFYLNGGSIQRGCSSGCSDGFVETGCLSDVCAHLRAWEFFAETITRNTSMPGVSCDSWDQFKNGQCNTSDISLMGFSCDTATRGRYYLQTNAGSPYGLGTEGLTYVNYDGVDSIIDAE